jgi:hypothetical protein
MSGLVRRSHGLLRRTAYVGDEVFGNSEAERLVDARCLVVVGGKHHEVAARAFAECAAADLMHKGAANALATMVAIGGDRLEATEIAHVEEAGLTD